MKLAGTFQKKSVKWQGGRKIMVGSASSAVRDPNGYFIEDLLADWQKLRWVSFKENTKIFYTNLIPQLEPLFGIEVEKINPEVIEEWLLYLQSPEKRKTYKSNKTSLEKELDLFKAMIKWYIGRNYKTELRYPIKESHKELLFIKPKKVKISTYMTLEEFDKWLSILKNHSMLFWALALAQQKQILRISEVSAMKWSNLDIARRTYRVTEHLIWPRVNGRIPEFVPGTKTNKSGEAFNSYLRLEVMHALRELESTRSSDLIFTIDGTPLTYRQIQYAYDKAFIEAKLPYRSTHVLRHTGATLFLEETGDPLALQQMGNWQDQRMALHYGKILNSRAREAVERIEQKKFLKLVRTENE